MKLRGVWMRWIIGLLVILALLASLAFLFEDSLVQAMANFLVVSDIPEKSDLIFVLGGDYERRAPLAAELYREGWAPKVLLVRERPPEIAGRENFTDITAGMLEADGVPENRIVRFSPARGVQSTADEARALRLYADYYPVKKILVVTSAYHSRRARMALRRVLLGTSTEVRMITVETPSEFAEDWRKTPYQRNLIKLEWIKTVYYFFTFF